MRPFAPVFALGCALGLAWGGEPEVRFVLAPTVVVGDPAPDDRLPSSSRLQELLRSEFARHYPPDAAWMPSEGDPLGPRDRVVLLVATIECARVVETIRADTIHDFEAIVVGDVTALDPWTDARLFAGTRLVAGQVSLGDSAVHDRDARLKDAFDAVVQRWLQRALEQFRAEFRPFVLDAPTVATPAAATPSSGGVWPFGAKRGVRRGQVLRGPGSSRARVVQVFEQYASIESVDAPGSRIAPGTTFRATVVDDGSRREDPRVTVRWIGPAPVAADGLSLAGIDDRFVAAVFRDYLAKEGGLAILPPAGRGGEPSSLVEFSRDVSRYSERVMGEFLEFQRETLIQRASERPEFIIEIGVLDAYHGVRPGPQGSTEHRYRVELLAAIFQPGADERETYRLTRTVRSDRSEARLELHGVREPDHEGVWLIVLRDAAIGLATKVRTSLLDSRTTAAMATVGSEGRVDWSGLQPAPKQPLTWLRPVGPLNGARGESLGMYFEALQPSTGYLTLANLDSEPLQPGDRIRFEAATAWRAALSVEPLSDGSEIAMGLDHDVLARLTAGWLAETIGRPIELLAQDASPGPGSIPDLRAKLWVARLGSQVQPQGAAFNSEWRFGVRGWGAAASSDDLSQCGIAHQPTLTTTATPFEPFAVSAHFLEVARTGFESLIAECRRRRVLERIRAD